MANDEQAEVTHRCTLCDKPVTKRGQYGHLKFTDGDGHGPKGEVPENGSDYFMKLDTENGGNEGNSEGESSEPTKDREGKSESSGSPSKDTSDTDGSESGNSQTPDGEETAGETGENRSLRELLTTPINELL